MFAKKIEIKKDDIPLDDMSNVLRASELGKVNSLNRHLTLYKEKVEAFKDTQLEKIEQLKKDELKNARDEAFGAYLQEIYKVQTDMDKYYSLIEKHCADVVVKALDTLLDTIDDDVKVLCAVKHATQQLHQTDDIVLEVNPVHVDTFTELAASRNWSIRTNHDIAEDVCQIITKLGVYESSVSENINRIKKALMHS